MPAATTKNPESTGEGQSARRPRICVVVSAPMTVKAFLRHQLQALGRVYELTVVANAPNSDFLDEAEIPARFIRIPVERQIAPWNDLCAMALLFRCFRQNQYALVHSVTPKAGLLAMAAAFLAGVPHRIHIFTGQVWATKKGAPRLLLKSLDRLIALFATRVLVDSHSQWDFLLQNGVVRRETSSVLGKGSISGVDTTRFHPDAGLRKTVRAELELTDPHVAFLYVGRLNGDKGIPELLKAFEKVSSSHTAARLILVGPDEQNCDDLVSASPSRSLISRIGYTDSPERYMAASDVFVLPSHREGFGSTVIEAAAVGLPAIASRIYGLTDAVAEGRTGIFHEPGNTEEIAAAMVEFIENANLRHTMGRAAHERIISDFSAESMTHHVLAFYARTLQVSE